MKKQIACLILFLSFNLNILALNIIAKENNKTKNDKVEKAIETLKSAIDSDSKYKILKNTSTALALTEIGLEIAPLVSEFDLSDKGLKKDSDFQKIVPLAETSKDIINATIEIKESVVLEIIKEGLLLYKKYKKDNSKLAQEAKDRALKLLIERMSQYIISTNINKRIYRRILRTLINSAATLIPEEKTETNPTAIKTFLINLVYYSIVEIIGEMFIREIEAAEKSK
ncbi:MAG: hypothetical protein ABIA74_06355 [bacterium]